MSDIQQPQPIPLQPNPQIVPPSPPSPSDALAQRISNTFAAGGGGILNQLLFGIPGRTFAKGLVQQAQADPTSNLAYNIGQGAGAVGSMAVSPVGLLGKAVGAVPALAKTGSAIANLGTKGNVLGGLARGALEGGAFTGLQNVGANNPNAGSDILKSAALGGALGTVGSGLGGILSRRIPTATQTLTNIANDADAMAAKSAFGVGLKAVRQSLKSNPLTAGQLSEDAADKAYRRVGDMIRQGVVTNAQVQKITQEAGGEFEKANQVFDAVKAANHGDILRTATYQNKILNDPAVGEWLNWEQARSSPGNDFLTPALQRLTQDVADADSTGGLSAMKINLDRKVMGLKNQYYKTGDESAGREANALYSIRDMIAHDALNMAGVDPKVMEVWRDTAPIRNAILNETVKGPNSIFKGESVTGPTLALLNHFTQMGGRAIAGEPGAIVAATGLGAIQRGVATAANKGFGMLASRVRPITEKLMPFAQKLEQSGASDLGPTLMGTVPLASRVGGALAPAITAPMPQNQPATQAPVTVQDPAKFNDALSKGILLRIQQDVRYNPMLLNNPQWLAQAQAGVRNAISTNGKIDYQKAAPFLFNNPQDVEAYTRYAVPMMQIDTLLDQAGVGLGAGAFAKIRGALTPAVIQSRQGIVEAVQRATGSPAAAREAQAALTYAGWNKAQIEQRLKDILQRYAPNPGKLKGLLEQTGEM